MEGGATYGVDLQISAENTEKKERRSHSLKMEKELSGTDT